MTSDDPDFETKSGHIIGLYLNLPHTLRSSVWMRNPLFKLSTSWIRCFPNRPALSMARNRYIQRPLTAQSPRFPISSHTSRKLKENANTT